MSYILDALKKAQEERQIGALPTIHAPARQLSVRSNKPLWLALGGSAIVLMAVALLLLRQTSAQLASRPNMSLEKALAAAPPVVAAVLLAPAPNSMASGLPRIPPAPKPMVRPAVPATVAISAIPAVLASPPPSAPPAVKAADEVLSSVHELPEQLQREIAPLQIKGYIYSKDPAERLLLTDKALRHEGEEVAPGLILEQLQAKSALFSYKGYRYLVPY